MWIEFRCKSASLCYEYLLPIRSTAGKVFMLNFTALGIFRILDGISTRAYRTSDSSII